MHFRYIKAVLCNILCLAIIFTSVFFGDAFSTLVDSVAKPFIYNKELSQVLSQKEVCVSNNELYSATGYSGGAYTSAFTDYVSADIQALKLQAEKLFEGYTKEGEIKEIQMGATSKTLSYGVVEVDNKTQSSINLKTILSQKPSLKKLSSDEPSILIYHTHSTEGYELLDLGWYAKEYNSRTKDTSKNVVRVGEELTATLEEAGFSVIHDKTIYDESYNGAYSRSRVSVEKYLKKHPSIQITIDLHRDAIHYEDGTKCKPTATINGKKAAQVMIISGCEGNGVEDFPDWQKNLVFSTHLQGTVEEKYTGLMRPVFFCHRKYNMDVTPCSFLLEFGTDANTLEEAVYSAQLIGESFVRMLEEYK